MKAAKAILLAKDPSYSAIVMLLQMVLEKLSKAALLREKSIDLTKARSSHAVATMMVQQLAGKRRECQRLGWRQDTIRRQVLPLVEELERAHSQQASGRAAGRPECIPVLEYPWEDSSGAVLWPEEHHPIVRRFRSREGKSRYLFHFIDLLCQRFDEIFPEGS